MTVPYARIRSVIARESAGEHINDRKEGTVELRAIESKEDFAPKPRVKPKAPTTPGAVIADELLAADHPMDVMLRAENVTQRELHTAQQAGTRWLRYCKRADLRLSYRRTGPDEVAWFLTEKGVA